LNDGHSRSADAEGKSVPGIMVPQSANAISAGLLPLGLAGSPFMTKSPMLKVGYSFLAALALIFVGLLWLTTLHP